MKNENKYNFFSSVPLALIPVFDDQTKKANIVQNILIAKISFSIGKVLYNDQYFWSHGKSFFFTMCFVNSYDVDTNKIHHQDLTTAGRVQQSDYDVWSVNSISFDSL